MTTSWPMLCSWIIWWNPNKIRPGICFSFVSSCPMKHTLWMFAPCCTAWLRALLVRAEEWRSAPKRCGQGQVGGGYCSWCRSWWLIWSLANILVFLSKQKRCLFFGSVHVSHFLQCTLMCFLVSSCFPLCSPRNNMELTNCLWALAVLEATGPGEEILLTSLIVSWRLPSFVSRVDSKDKLMIGPLLDRWHLPTDRDFHWTTSTHKQKNHQRTGFGPFETF